jgi:SAM-dependent methyltransferase
VIGLDPDPAVLEIARTKADAAGVAVDWRQGLGDALTAVAGPASLDKVVSSLVLHQCPLPVKRSILASAREVLRPGGQLLIADYGWQRTFFMRLLFRQVQALDGFDKTQPNADGVLPDLMRQAGLEKVEEVSVTPTPTGSISIYRAERPA